MDVETNKTKEFSLQSAEHRQAAGEFCEQREGELALLCLNP